MFSLRLVVGLSFGRWFGLLGVEFVFDWIVSLVLAEKMTERDDEIASLWSRKGVYQRHVKKFHKIYLWIYLFKLMEIN